MSKKKIANAGVRLLPALMITLAALVGLKAVAMAQGVAETAGEGEAKTEEAKAQGDAPAPDACTPASFAETAGLSQSEVQVLQALGARRTQLDERAAEIETRADLFTAAERRISERIEELKKLETEVAGLLGRLDEDQEQRMANLVDVYQRMRGRDAAAVFDTLDDDTLVAVASRMRQTNLAEIMGRMQPQRARRLTQMLAERARPVADGEALLNRNAPAAAPAAEATPR